MEEYLVPTKEGVGELTEKRSRFIGHIWRTDTEEEAIAAIRATRERMWDARHHVYAYLIRGGAMRYSDDGEPQGTGGMCVREGVEIRPWKVGGSGVQTYELYVNGAFHSKVTVDFIPYG